jgi:glycosyltransferase involved in cell wall biosynthesis
MKVVHVVLSLDVGGMERNVLNQVREDGALGQQSSILCLERPGTLAAQAQKLGAEVLSVDKRPGIRPGVLLRIRSALKAMRPDVVHTHQIGPLFYASLASCGLGIPLIIHTEHGREDYLGRRGRWLGQIGAMRVSRFYCLTQDLVDWVISSGIVPREKVRLIHNGINLSTFQERHDRLSVRRSAGIPAEARVIGTVGRLVEVKGHDLLIRAFAAIQHHAPDLRLVLVGAGPLESELRDLATGLGVADGVHFVGYQPNSAPYLQAFDVFALTSRSEGMPQVVLEASICGVPIVAPRVGGVPEVIEHHRTGLLFEPGDQRGLEAAIRAILNDQRQADEMSRTSRKWVEARFDVKRMAREYHDQCLEMIQNKYTKDRTTALPSRVQSTAR